MRSRLVIAAFSILVMAVLTLPGCTGDEGPQMPPVGDAYEKAEEGLSVDEFKTMLPGVELSGGQEEGVKWGQASDDKFIYGFKFHEDKLIEKTKTEKAN